MSMSRAAILLAVLALLLPGAAGAIELPQNKPTNDPAALEQRLLQQRDMPSGRIEGFVHIPDEKAGVLIQPQGRFFRDVRTRFQPWFNAGLIAAAVAAMAALYLIAGSMRVAKDPYGRTIQRFTWFERVVHWFTAVSFIWLALTGLNLVFGRWLLLPLVGGNAFAELSRLAKVSHNAVGIAFTLGLVVMAAQWLRNNLPSRYDMVWLKSYGGMFGGPHPPAEKFNTGQKMIYWLAVLGGALISVTGILLLFPFYGVGIMGMQITHGLHSIASALMIAVIIGHIYFGTIGVRGSFEAMSTGRVDLNWAREHHGLWVEDEEAKGRIPPGSSEPLRPHPAE